MSGLPKVTYSEINKTVLPTSQTGVPVLLNVRANRGPLTPQLVNSASALVTAYTETGKFEVSDYQDIFEAAIIAEGTNECWVNRVCSNAMYGGLRIEQGSKASVGAGSIKDPSAYDVTTNDGRHVFSEVTFTVDGGALDALVLNNKAIFDSLTTGQEVKLVKVDPQAIAPAPLAFNTSYYVIKLENNRVQLALSKADAEAHPAVNIHFTSTGLGEQKLVLSENVVSVVSTTAEPTMTVAEAGKFSVTLSDEDWAPVAEAFGDGEKYVELTINSLPYSFIATAGDKEISFYKAEKTAQGQLVAVDFTAAPFSLVLEANVNATLKVFAAQTIQTPTNLSGLKFVESNTLDYSQANEFLTKMIEDYAGERVPVDLRITTLEALNVDQNVTDAQKYSLINTVTKAFIELDDKEAKTVKVWRTQVDTSLNNLGDLFNPTFDSITSSAGLVTLKTMSVVDIAPIELTSTQETIASEYTVNLEEDYITYGSKEAWSELKTGDQVTVSAVNGSLPTPLDSSVTYYAYKDSLSLKAKLCATLEDASKGIGIDITGTPASTTTLYINNESVVELDEADQMLFMLYGKNPGSWNNNLSVAIQAYDPADSSSGLIEGSFKILVYENSVIQETWVVSRKQGLKNNSNQNIYIGNVLEQSALIGVVDSLVDENIQPTSKARTSFTGGDNGDIPTTGDMIVALDKLRNKRKFAGYYIPDLGIEDTAVAYRNALLAFAESEDVFAELSVPYSLDHSNDAYNQLDSWISSVFTTASSYGAINRPWAKKYDSYNDRYLTISPSAYFLSQEAKIGGQRNVMVPVLGNDTGKVNVESFDEKVIEEAAGYLYDKNINTALNVDGIGNVIMGAKTLERALSDLSYKPARMTLLWLKRHIAPVLTQFLGRQLDYSDPQGVINDIKMVLDDIFSQCQALKGIYTYSISFPQDTIAADIRQHRVRIHGTITFFSFLEFVDFTIICTPYTMEMAVSTK